MLVVGLCAACVLMYRQGGGDDDKPVVMHAALSIQHDMHDDGWYFEATNMDVLMEVTCFCPAGVKVTPEGVQAGFSAPGTMSFK